MGLFTRIPKIKLAAERPCPAHFHLTVTMHGMDGFTQSGDLIVDCTGDHREGNHHLPVFITCPLDFQHNHAADDRTVEKHESKVR